MEDELKSSTFFKPTKNILAKKTILVTGASRGIGLAVAKSFAECGARVILLARSVSNLEKAALEIADKDLAQPGVYPFNLATAKADDYDNLSSQLQKHYGKLDGVVHNAAVLGALTPIEQLSVQQWYQVMQVNLNSIFMLTKVLLPILKGGSVIFTGSKQKNQAYWGAYSVANAAVTQLMQILHEENNDLHAIRFNKIIPEKVETNFNKKAYPGSIGDGFKAEEIVNGYIYLMSEISKDISNKTYAATDFLCKV